MAVDLLEGEEAVGGDSPRVVAAAMADGGSRREARVAAAGGDSHPVGDSRQAVVTASRRVGDMVNRPVGDMVNRLARRAMASHPARQAMGRSPRRRALSDRLDKAPRRGRPDSPKLPSLAA